MRKTELAKKYNLSYHHIEYLRYYFHVELTKEDTYKFWSTAVQDISPEKKAMSLQKRNDNMIKKYGVRNMAWIEGAQEKKRQTNLSKYGVEVSSQC